MATSGQRSGGELGGKRCADLVEIEAARADGAGVDIIAEDPGELRDRVRVIRIRRISGRRYQLKGACPAAVLSRAVPPTARANFPGRAILLGGDGLELMTWRQSSPKSYT